MSTLWRPALVIILCGLFCPQLLARASGDGGEGARVDDCGDMTLEDDKDMAPAAGAVVEAVEVIVPCAVVESGALGADCHDAAFYVVNQTGTLLCRVDIAAFSTQVKSTTIESAAPAAPTSSSAAIASAMATAVLDIQIPRQSVVDLPRAAGPAHIGPGIDLTSFSPRPS